MRIDLFEFVEGIFRGFIYFFYNLFATLWDLARRPRRGPVRRYRAYLRASRQQIGGLTFLFVVIFTIFGLSAALATEKPTAIFGSPFNFAGEAAWLPLLGAMLATVLVDAPLRLLLHWRLRRRERRRRLVLELVEYSLSWPLLLGFGAPIIVLTFDLPFDSLAAVLLAILVLWLIAWLACGPAARFLLAGLRGGRARPRGGVGRLALQLGTQLAMFLLLFMGVVSGGGFSIYIGESAAEPRSVEEVLELPYLRCFLDDPNPHVVVAARNPGKAPIFLDVDRELVVRVSDRGEIEELNAFELPLIAEGGRDAMPLMIEPGATKLLRLSAEGRPGRPFAEGDLCMLRALRGVPKFENYLAQTVEKPDSAHFNIPTR